MEFLPNIVGEKFASFTEILSHRKKLSSNQLFSDFYSKTIAFTKSLRKECEREFLQFPHCVRKTKKVSQKKFRQINFSNFFIKNVPFTKFLPCVKLNRSNAIFHTLIEIRRLLAN